MANLVGEAACAAYRRGATLLAPLVIPAVLALRTRGGKEDPARRAERYGRASRPRPPGRVVWIHAVSVGETVAAMPVVDRLTASGCSVVLTSTTLTSAETAAARLPGGAVHQFNPFDVPAYLRRFIDHWRPELAIFVEAEVWPTMTAELAGAAIPLVVVNARMSDRSFRAWRRWPPIATAVFGKIDLCLAQSPTAAERFAALGAQNVVVTGELKLDASPLAADPVALAALRAAIGGRPVWLAASTHAGEEAIVAEAHKRARLTYPDLLAVIVPRHPSRGAAIGAMLTAAGLTAARRSRDEPLDRAVDVYLADTLGELGLFYRLAPIAFVGNSLVRGGGGHNAMEAVRLDAAVLHGPAVENFADLYGSLDRQAAAGLVHDAASLAEAVVALLADPDRRTESARRAQAALPPPGRALDATMAALAPYLSVGKEPP